MYVLKNKSNNILDIMGKKIHPSEELHVRNINPYRNLIKTGFLQIIEEDAIQLVTLPKKQFIDKQIINNINSNRKIQQSIQNNFPPSKDKVVTTQEVVIIEEEPKNETISQELINDLVEQKLVTVANSQEEKLNSLINEKIDSLQQQINNHVQLTTKQNEILHDDLNQIKENLQSSNKKAQSEILSSLFHFYIDKKLSEQDLENVKYFFINISDLKTIPQTLKDEIQNTLTYEELITILLNSVYPYIFKIQES